MSNTEVGAQVTAALRAAELANAESVDAAVDLVLGCVRSDALVYSAGAGHSLAAVAETFYRAGGLACVYPLHAPELLPMNGARASTVAERRSGLAEQVLAARPPEPGDVVVVFSTSGVNPYPVELAAVAAARGAAVIAVSSRACVAAAPDRGVGTLLEHATVVLDTAVPPGDASFPADNPRTAALSSVLNAFLWNLMLAGVFRRAEAEGIDVPLWRSSNVEGGDAANAGLLEHYRPRIPALR